MGSYGYQGDVNNSISGASAYPGRRTQIAATAAGVRMGVRNNSAGELRMSSVTTAGAGVARSSAPADMAAPDNQGITGKPVGWWLTILVIFIAVIWLMKKFAPSEGREFGNIQPGLYNGVFLTLYIVLILSVLKVLAGKIQNVPGLRKLADLLLAV